MEKISVTILVKNSGRYIKEVLQALASFDEVLLYDNGSVDDTLDIAEKFHNVRIVKGTFEGFGKTHNKASQQAKNDWILSIDSDEVITEELAKELATLTLEEGTVYSLPRNNYFNGKWIRSCGWYPDRQYRLYNKNKTRFTAANVHEQIEIEGMKHKKLKGALIHYSYATIDEFMEKMRLYSTLFAEQNRGKKRSSPLKAWLHGIAAFLKSYIIKRGIFQGYEGFVISSYNGHTAYYKYLKLFEANSKL